MDMRWSLLALGLVLVLPACSSVDPRAAACGDDLNKISAGMPEDRMLLCYLDNPGWKPFRESVVDHHELHYYTVPDHADQVITVADGAVAGGSF
jgi:hypothetical protein